jgi:hypothetical protein
MGYSNDLRVRVIQVVEGGAAARAKNSARGRGRLGCFTSLATFTRCSKPINAKTATSDVPATSTPGLCVACGRPISGRRVKTSSYGRARQQGPGNRRGLTLLFRVHPLVRRDLSGALANSSTSQTGSGCRVFRAAPVGRFAHRSTLRFEVAWRPRFLTLLAGRNLPKIRQPQ